MRRLPILLIHANCPKPTGPNGSLLAYDGGHANTGGARYSCEACGLALLAVNLDDDPHDDGAHPHDLAVALREIADKVAIVLDRMATREITRDDDEDPAK